MTTKSNSVGAIYYTENRLDEKIAVACREQLRKVFKGEVVACSLKPIDFGDTRIVLDLERGYLTMFKQILAALEASTAEVVFFAEHDVLYPKEHFDFIPPDKDKFYYNGNWWKTRSDGFAVRWNAIQVSGLCCYRVLAIKFYKDRIAAYEDGSFDRKFEPTSNGQYETWWSERPLVDVRHQGNLTYNKWHIQHFRDKSTAEGLQEATVEEIPGWNLTTRDIYG